MLTEVIVAGGVRRRVGHPVIDTTGDRAHKLDCVQERNSTVALRQIAESKSDPRPYVESRLAALPLMCCSATYETQQAFSAGQTDWPFERWWTDYANPKLNLLIDVSLRGAPDMLAAEARLRRAEAMAGVAGAALGPQVSANASANSQKLSYNYLTPPTMTPEEWSEYGRATLDLSWELDFWGCNRAGVAAAKSQVEASAVERAQACLSLVAAIAAGYADLVQSFAERDTAERSVGIRTKTLALFEERYSNGLETLGTVSGAKAALARAEGELLAVDESIALQRIRLAALLGAGPDRGLAISRPVVNLAQGYLQHVSPTSVDL